MTDREILTEVHQMLGEGIKSHAPHPARQCLCDVKSFVEQEWQKRDEQEYDETVPSFSKKWYTDVREMERHRGLEIGPDGTVMEVK